MLKKIFVLFFVLLQTSVLCFADEDVRWEKFPVNVYIKPQQKRNIAIEAFEEWQKALNMKVFNFVNEQKSPVIIFDYKMSDNKTNKTSCRQGNTRVKYYKKSVNGVWGPKYINTADITVSPRSCYDGTALDDKALLIVNMHEVGHALGLIHSVNKNDIMYPVVTIRNRVAPNLSINNDVRAFKRKYNFK